MTALAAPPSSSSSSLRPALAALKPREHALWAWVLVPLVAAVGLAPGVVTGAGAAAVLLGFLAHNGLGHAWRRPSRAAWGLAGGLLAAAVLAGLVAAWASGAPRLGAAAVVGAVAVVGLGARTFRGVYPVHAGLELGGIFGLVGVGALLAVGGGASVAASVAVALGLGTWFAVGWWWVKGQLATVLPRREVPSWGVLVPALGLPLVLLATAAVGHVAVGFVTCLYGSRASLHAPPAGPRDARRIGLTELGWSLLAAAAMVGVA